MNIENEYKYFDKISTVKVRKISENMETKTIICHMTLTGESRFVCTQI